MFFLHNGLSGDYYLLNVWLGYLGMKILNAYAGIGGNRKDWANVEVTAVEMNLDIASVYADLYPDDTLIIGDAHDYILNHFHEFDLVWSSAPCQTHSSIRQNLGVRFQGAKPIYPNMKLWQEIIFLQHNSPALWIVENVKPYYEPLIKPVAIIQRHCFWSNFFIPTNEQFKNDVLRTAQIPDLQLHHGIDLSHYKLSNKRQVLRNCVYSPLGAYLLEVARRNLRHERPALNKAIQDSLFTPVTNPDCT